MKCLELQCPTCGAIQEELCFDRKSLEAYEWPRRFHKRRLDLAEQMTQEENGKLQAALADQEQYSITERKMRAHERMDC